MKLLEHLFENNVKWADSMKEKDPNFFKNLANGQKPEILWIGCSDSRVPANQIIDLPPGEVFVHRNIANMVIHTDLNSLSVIQYAVEVLKVKHVIVCGHYGCGGIKAALDNEDHGLIDNWLRHIEDVHNIHEKDLKDLDEKEYFDRMCELNVVHQVKNLTKTTIVQDAWKSGSDVTVHGLVYSLENGYLKDLNISINSIAKRDELFK